MPDWFDQNAPKSKPTGDWFDENAPTIAPSPFGPRIIGKAVFPEDLAAQLGRAAIRYLPAAAATGATLLAPPGLIPALGAAAAGGATGSMLQQGIEKVFGQPGAPRTLEEFGERATGETLTQTGAELGGRFITGALSRVFGRYFNPEQLYQSALAPTKVVRQKAVRAGIEEGIVLGPSALPETRAAWQELNREITAQIATDPNKPVPFANLFQGIDRLKAKWAQHATPASRLEAIDRVEREFILTHAGLPATIPGPGGKALAVDTLDTSTLRAMAASKSLTGQQAQAIKKMTYEGMRPSGGGPGPFAAEAHPVLTVRAQKEIASALRQELETLYPGIKELNRREGALIELERALDRFVAREGNKRMTPYFAPLLAGALIGGAAGGGAYGGYAGGGLGAAAGAAGAHLIRSAVEDPTVKSKLAIVLSRVAQNAAVRGIRVAAPYAPQALIRTGLASTLAAPPRGTEQ